jgi:hypothetical protein
MKIIKCTILFLTFTSIISGNGLHIIINTINEIDLKENDNQLLAQEICEGLAHAIISSIKNAFGMTHVEQLNEGSDYKCQVIIKGDNEKAIKKDNSDCIVTSGDKSYVLLKPQDVETELEDMKSYLL